MSDRLKIEAFQQFNLIEDHIVSVCISIVEQVQSKVDKRRQRKKMSQTQQARQLLHLKMIIRSSRFLYRSASTSRPRRVGKASFLCPE